MMMTSSEDIREDIRKGELGGDESFNQILAEVKAVAKDRDEELQLLTERIVFDLIHRKPNNKAQPPSNVSKKRHSPDETLAAKKKRKVITEINYIEEKAAAARNYLEKIRNKNRSRKDIEDEYEASKLINKKKKKAKKAANSRSSIPSPPPDMPIGFKNKIESWHGYQVELVMHKRLFATDLSLRHDRLSLPVNQLITKNFLGEEFETRLKNGGLVPVKVIDTRLKEHELSLTKWNASYVINRGWNSISTDETDQLNAEDVLQIWSFRVNDNPDSNINQERLCFALVELKDHAEKKTNGSQEAVESSTSKKDQGNERDTSGGTQTDSMVEAIGSSMSEKDEGKEDVNGGTDGVEGIESSSMSKKDEGKEDIGGSTATAGHDAVESSMNKNQSAFGARQYVSLKFRNVTIARIQSAVSVV